MAFPGIDGENSCGKITPQEQYLRAISPCMLWQNIDSVAFVTL